jgi:hypothetical protein
VESWVNLGIPDCILSIDKRFVLVELKVAAKSGRIKLSAHQVAFHEAHKEYLCFILASFGEVGSREIWLYPSCRVKELANKVCDPDLRVKENAEGWETMERTIIQLSRL